MESNNIQESIGGRYIIHKERGSGTTSEVFKVQDNNTQNIYAAKVFKKQSPYFQREIDMLTALRPTNNPFMINIIDSGIGTVIRKDQTQNNKQYIILDYTPKDELLQYLCLINEPLKELHAKLIFFKILKGVQNCHNAGICHLDLKTDNILLGENFEPKLCDFGFAIRNNGHLREFLGTGPFIAPELFLGKSFDGFKADIFSLGVVLLNLTTCKFGFEKAVQNNKYYIEIMIKHYGQYWLKLSNVISGISDNLKNLYVKMVAYKPSERPTIEKIINSEWMRELREMNNEQLTQLENEVREEFLRRESLMIAAKEQKKEINNELFGSNNSSGNRGFTADNGLFDLNLKPCYAKSKLNMDNYIKLTGNINPGKFMNDLVVKINKLDGAYINADKDEFKLNVTFEKEEEDFEIPEDMKEELKKLGIYVNEENEEENENIKGKTIVVEIKIFQSYSGGYLLKFAKKEGVLIDYLEKVEKINSLIQKM